MNLISIESLRHAVFWVLNKHNEAYNKFVDSSSDYKLKTFVYHNVASFNFNVN